jgi:hypothetical protein
MVIDDIFVGFVLLETFKFLKEVVLVGLRVLFMEFL